MCPVGEEISRNAVQPDAYGFIGRHRGDPDLHNDGYESVRRPVTAGDEAARVEAEHRDVFLACREGEPLGSVSLKHIDLHGRNAELGHWIVPDVEGSVYATEAAALFLPMRLGN